MPSFTLRDAVCPSADPGQILRFPTQDLVVGETAAAQCCIGETCSPLEDLVRFHSVPEPASSVAIAAGLVFLAVLARVRGVR